MTNRMVKLDMKFKFMPIKFHNGRPRKQENFDTE
jgi:hypothetical protein